MLIPQMLLLLLRTNYDSDTGEGKEPEEYLTYAAEVFISYGFLLSTGVRIEGWPGRSCFSFNLGYPRRCCSGLLDYEGAMS